MLDESGAPLPSTSLTITTVDEHTHDHMQEGEQAAARNTQAPDADEWIPDESNLQGNWRSRQPDSPHAQLPPLKAGPGVTALARARRWKTRFPRRS
ncbi:MAG TPA: hypothetical protein VE842_03245 [Pyrinomonadaceae bacterium]|nr:hypothetical protein [Pyrinomonadaceae bacterium]